jgi:hypothetical protein
MAQMIRHFGGLGEPVVDTLLEQCAYTHKSNITPLARNNDCPCEHVRWRRCSLPGPLSNYTPRELVRTALGLPATAAGVSLTLDRLHFCEVAICTDCGAQQALGRLVGRFRGIAKCTACGGSLDASPFNTHRPVPLPVLAAHLDRPLQDFADQPPEAAVVRAPNAAVLCRCAAAGDPVTPLARKGKTCK